MKKKHLFFIVILLVFGFFFSSQGLFCSTTNDSSRDFAGVYLLKEKQSLIFTIDYGWERNGMIPVTLALRDLEITWRIKKEDLPGEELQNEISNMLIGNPDLDLLIYEQNPMRIRLISQDPKLIKLKLNTGGRVEVYYGANLLRLERFLFEFREVSGASTPLYRLLLRGPGVRITHHGELVLEPSGGSIFLARDLDSRLSILQIDSALHKKEGWSQWAGKIKQEKYRELEQDR